MTMSDKLDFSGKAVVVTGGGKGVGRVISQCFLAAGAELVICGRTRPDVLPSVDGREAVFVEADVRDPDASAAVIEAAVDTDGRIDGLINNAGGGQATEGAHASPRFSEAIVRRNLLAALNCAQQANVVMQRQEEGGVIVNISSVRALRPSPGTAAYGAAKAGLLSLTESLAVEWAPRVRVNAVIGGMVRTEQAHLHYGDEEGIASVAATVPLGRLADPSDLGDACVFLASPMAAYISGAGLLVHGGGEKPAFLGAAANTSGSK